MGSPLSTFSSTPNTSAPNSTETPTSKQLECEGISDEEIALEPPTFRQLEGIHNEEIENQANAPHLHTKAPLTI